MSYYIKTGLWFKSREGHKGSLDLDALIKEKIANTPINYQDFSVATEPATPPTGHLYMWMDSTGTLMVKDDTGIIKEVQFVNL